MQITMFLEKLEAIGIDHYAGVPDSQLSALCDHLVAELGTGGNHVIAANEGAAVAIAAGHYLATGKPGLVYMQNSGIGNSVNPICSLLSDRVYAIPVQFVIGWRGEPGVHDEPQHVFQGEVTLPLLETLGIATMVLTSETTETELDDAVELFAAEHAAGRSTAFVVKKGALSGGSSRKYENVHPSTREEIVNVVVDSTREDDIIVSTTGKLSRELFEAREARGQGHGADFLTVGSMGHASMIGLGVALDTPSRRVFVLDGDGAALMHAGSLAVLAAAAPANLVHVVVNNEAHESVGGMPTVAPSVDFCAMAAACGYPRTFSAADAGELAAVLARLEDEAGGGPAGGSPVFIEVKASIGARADLGRPTTTPIENRDAFMRHVAEGAGGDSAGDAAVDDTHGGVTD